jgi:hypothetical protein
MSAITIQLPDELRARVRGHEEHLPEIIELGLRHFEANVVVEEETTKVLEFFANSPTPQEVLDLRSSERLHHRVSELIALASKQGLNEREQKEWERYEHVEHLVRMAKMKAQMQLAANKRPNA